MKKIHLFILLILFSIPMLVWLNAEGNPLDYFVYQVPAGQSLYVFTKLIGLYTFFLLWLHIIWVLLRQTALTAYLPQWKKNYHQTTGLIITGLIILHISLFVIAVSLRQGEFAYHLLLPNFSDYYHSLLGLGVLALWLLPLVIIAGMYLKSGKGKRYWHYLAFFMFLLIFVHGIGVGSETKNGILFWFYLMMGCSVIIALLYRFILTKYYS